MKPPFLRILGTLLAASFFVAGAFWLVAMFELVCQDFPVCLRRQGLEVPPIGSAAYKWAFVRECFGYLERAAYPYGIVCVTSGLMVIDFVKNKHTSLVLHSSTGFGGLLIGFVVVMLALYKGSNGAEIAMCPWPAFLVFYRPLWRFGLSIMTFWAGLAIGVWAGLAGVMIVVSVCLALMGLIGLHYNWHIDLATRPFCSKPV